ncbi:MAG TPA: hypothetical protein VLK33_15480 [Terriglobales bacterium]|nr:hypothetical protein [Terriglobales bacterium]
MKTKSFLFVLLLSALIFSACGGGSGPQPTMIPTLPPKPFTGTEATLPSFGFGAKTATPEAASGAPASGWLAFDTASFGLWLPPTYAPSEVGAVDFFAVDATVNNPDGYMTKVSVNDATSDDPIETYAAATADSVTGTEGVTLVSSAPASIEGFDAWQLVSEYEENGVLLRDDIYLLKSGNTVWILMFTTAASEFDARSADFALTAGSFFAK